METKYCPKCKTNKPSTDYYKAISRYDGLRAYCKDCSNKMQRDNTKYFTDYSNNRYKNDVTFREKRKLQSLNYQKLYKDKHGAHQAVEYALATNKLIKQPCEKCSNPNSQAHHDDYSKPLQVRWLCPKCHTNYHINER